MAMRYASMGAGRRAYPSTRNRMGRAVPEPSNTQHSFLWRLWVRAIEIPSDAEAVSPRETSRKNTLRASVPADVDSSWS
jgi:hypothetical protein